MKGIPQGRYNREFRQEAVRLVVEERIACRKVALQLSLASMTISIKPYLVKIMLGGSLLEKKDLGSC